MYLFTKSAVHRLLEIYSVSSQAFGCSIQPASQKIKIRPSAGPEIKQKKNRFVTLGNCKSPDLLTNTHNQIQPNAKRGTTPGEFQPSGVVHRFRHTRVSLQLFSLWTWPKSPKTASAAAAKQVERELIRFCVYDSNLKPPKKQYTPT